MGYSIEFEPVGRRGVCPESGTLLDAARQLGVDLVSICGGEGSCGQCQVKLVAGTLSNITEVERECLTRRELDQGYRLACQARPLDKCRIHVPPESLTTLQRTQVEGLDVSVTIQPPVRRYEVQIDPPSIEDVRGDDERIAAALRAADGQEAHISDIVVMRDAGPALRRSGWKAALTLRGREIVAITPPGAPWLGLALDVGTTKIAGYLIDLVTGQTLATRGVMNPQIAYGEDVVARLNYANQGPAQSGQMQKLLSDAVNNIASETCSEIGADPVSIVESVLVCNTAIHHLLLSLPVTALSTAPYVPVMQAAVDVKARDLGLDLAPGAYAHLLPCIAGFVGADHVAMLVATGAGKQFKNVLAIDIGTNTEICLATEQGKMTSLSCASGPAFEGAHIKHGMRAAPGAIERVRIAKDGRVEYKTIGDQPPIGLCGSGLVDAVAQMYKAGVIDRRGRLAKDARVRQVENDFEFVIAEASQASNGQAITVSQHDIRELQLAKGAIRCGIDTLLENADLAVGDLEQVIIAGAFGTYIDVASAIAIGMLPELPQERFVQVGNAAGTGARLSLISQEMREEAQRIAQRVHYVELACAPDFTHNFATAMYFPNAEG